MNNPIGNTTTIEGCYGVIFKAGVTIGGCLKWTAVNNIRTKTLVIVTTKWWLFGGDEFDSYNNMRISLYDVIDETDCLLIDESVQMKVDVDTFIPGKMMNTELIITVK